MAIATGTAMTIAAATGLAATAATTTMSFVQAGKQKQAQKDAQRAAEEALNEAKKQLDTNFYDKLSVPMQAYELQREALLSQGAQAIQAGVESERGAAATAGRVMLAQQQGQQDVTAKMAQELSNLDKLSAQEDARLAGLQSNISLQEAAGAQAAAADAARLRAQAIQQGFQGVQSLGKQAIQAAPLYAKQDVDALGNPIELRPEKYALDTSVPSYQNTFGQSSPFITNPFGIPGLTQ